MLQDLGVKSYRFSLSWPRLIPDGSRGSTINENGVKFYSDLIDALIEAGIVPFVVSGYRQDNMLIYKTLFQYDHSAWFR